jgi:hypothetical protein
MSQFEIMTAFYIAWAIGRAIHFFRRHRDVAHWMTIGGLAVLHGITWPVSYFMFSIRKFEDWIES